MILVAALSLAIGTGPWNGRPRSLMKRSSQWRLFPRNAAASILALVDVFAIVVCFWHTCITVVPLISIEPLNVAMRSYNPPPEICVNEALSEKWG